MKKYVLSLISMSLIMTLNAANDITAVEIAACKAVMAERMEKQRKETALLYQQMKQQEIVIVPAGTYAEEVAAVTTPFGTTARITKRVSSNEPMVSRREQRPVPQNQSYQHAAAQSWTINPADGIIYEDDGRGNVRKVEASEDLACRDELEEMAASSRKATEEAMQKQRELGLFKDRNIYIAQNKKTKKYRVMENKHDLHDDEKLYSSCSGRSVEQVKREFGITE